MLGIPTERTREGRKRANKVRGGEEESKLS